MDLLWKSNQNEPLGDPGQQFWVKSGNTLYFMLEMTPSVTHLLSLVVYYLSFTEFSLKYKRKHEGDILGCSAVYNILIKSCNDTKNLFDKYEALSLLQSAPTPFNDFFKPKNLELGKN